MGYRFLYILGTSIWLILGGILSLRGMRNRRRYSLIPFIAALTLYIPEFLQIIILYQRESNDLTVNMLIQAGVHVVIIITFLVLILREKNVDR